MAKAKNKSLLDGLVVRKGAAAPTVMPAVPLKPKTDESGGQTWTRSSIDPSLMLTPESGSRQTRDLPKPQMAADDGAAAANPDRQNQGHYDRMTLGKSTRHGVVVEKRPVIDRIADVFCPRQNVQATSITAAVDKTGTPAYSAIFYLRPDQVIRLDEIAERQNKNISKLVESAIDCFLDVDLSRR